MAFAPTAPTSWERVRLDRLFRPRRQKPLPGDELVSAFIDGQVTLRSNRPEQIIKSSGMEGGYKRIRSGDLAISGMNAHLGGLGISDSDGRCSPVYLVLEPTREINPQFCSFLLRHMALSGYIASFIQTIRYNSSDFKLDDLKKFVLPIPPLAVQNVVAEYLDVETARIDALIEKKRRMIELLQEHYRSAVDSMLHQWPAVPLKRVTYYQEGPGIMAADFVEEGVPLIRIAGIGDDRVTRDGCNFLDPMKVASKWSHFRVGVG